jgi:hypothetical protein
MRARKQEAYVIENTQTGPIGKQWRSLHGINEHLEAIKRWGSQSAFAHCQVKRLIYVVINEETIFRFGEEEISENTP